MLPANNTGSLKGREKPLGMQNIYKYQSTRIAVAGMLVFIVMGLVLFCMYKSDVAKQDPPWIFWGMRLLLLSPILVAAVVPVRFVYKLLIIVFLAILLLAWILIAGIIFLQFPGPGVMT